MGSEDDYICVCGGGTGEEGGGGERAVSAVGIQRVCLPSKMILQIKLTKGKSDIYVKCK